MRAAPSDHCWMAVEVVEALQAQQEPCSSAVLRGIGISLASMHTQAKLPYVEGREELQKVCLEHPRWLKSKCQHL